MRRIHQSALLHFMTECWTKIGKALRELEFEACTCSAEVLIEILRVPPDLKSLKMGRVGENWSSLQCSVERFAIGSIPR